MNFPRSRSDLTLWKIERLRRRRGQFFNSPTIESWHECGTIRAQGRADALIRARSLVGASEVRVSAVDEFYRPESLLP